MKNHLQTLWIITLISVTVIASESMMEVFKLQPNLKSVHQSVQGIVTSSLTECIASCRLHHKCEAINFEGNLQLCDLLVFEGGQKLQSSHGSTFAILELRCSQTSCYSFIGYESQVTKQEADNTCESIGGHVLAPENPTETEFITQNVLSGMQPVNHVWINLVGNFYWDHNREIMSYANWNKNEPDDHPSSVCVVGIMPLLKWIDLQCWLKYVLICEIDM